MSTTAQKLTYLNDTKGLLKDSINSLGGNITSQTTFRQYATELDSIYASLPKVSGSGSILSLSPTLKGRLASVLKGNTLQDGTPTPTTPVEIQSATGLQNINVCGKNLLDISYSKLGYSIDSSTGEVVQFSNNVCGENYIKVQPNTKYTISSSKEIGFLRLSEYNNNKQHIQRTQGLSTYSYTITTSSNTYYVRWSLNYNQAEITQQILESLDLQLEKGSTATTYEAYQSQTKELNLGTIKLNKIGNYQDTITGTPNNWSIKRQIGSVVLDGSEIWFGPGYELTNSNRFYSSSYLPDSVQNIALSNKFQSVNAVTINNTDSEALCRINEKQIAIRLNKSRATTLADFKTWLSNNNVEVYYVLATPTTTPITDTELISQLNAFYNAKSYNGQTNISVDGDLPMILDVNALKGEE